MNGINLHEDKDLFREAIAFTNTVTKFPQRLIEKDYYCSVGCQKLNSIKMISPLQGLLLSRVYRFIAGLHPALLIPPLRGLRYVKNAESAEDAKIKKYSLRSLRSLRWIVC